MGYHPFPVEYLYPPFKKQTLKREKFVPPLRTMLAVILHISTSIVYMQNKNLYAIDMHFIYICH